MPEGTPEIRGYDLETGRDLDGLMAAMLTSGFQATQLGRAVDVVNEMVRRSARRRAASPCVHHCPQDACTQRIVVRSANAHACSRRCGTTVLVCDRRVRAACACTGVHSWRAASAALYAKWRR